MHRANVDVDVVDSTDPTELRARMAVLALYRDLGIAPGDAMAISEIERLWPEVGVRASDLPWALESLVRDGFLARQAGAAERLVLTAVGERWMRDQPPWLEYRLLVLRAARMRYLRRHRASTPQVIPRRRRDDPPEPPELAGLAGFSASASSAASPGT